MINFNRIEYDSLTDKYKDLASSSYSNIDSMQNLKDLQIFCENFEEREKWQEFVEAHYDRMLEEIQNSNNSSKSFDQNKMVSDKNTEMELINA